MASHAARITRLPCNFSWLLSAAGRYSTRNGLFPSEELSLGGYNTIRGYDDTRSPLVWLIINMK